VGPLFTLFLWALEIVGGSRYRGFVIVANEKKDDEDRSKCCKAPIEWFSAIGHALTSREHAHYGRCSECKKTIYFVEKRQA
jgi:hypothetical protein